VDNSKQLEADFKRITDGLIEQINGILTNLEKRATKGDIQSSEEGLIFQTRSAAEAGQVHRGADQEDGGQERHQEGIVFIEGSAVPGEAHQRPVPAVVRQEADERRRPADREAPAVLVLRVVRHRHRQGNCLIRVPGQARGLQELGGVPAEGDDAGPHGPLRHRLLQHDAQPQAGAAERAREAHATVNCLKRNLMDSKDQEELNVKSLECLQDDSQLGKPSKNTIPRAKQ